MGNQQLVRKNGQLEINSKILASSIQFTWSDDRVCSVIFCCIKILGRAVILFIKCLSKEKLIETSFYRSQQNLIEQLAAEEKFAETSMRTQLAAEPNNIHSSCCL